MYTNARGLHAIRETFPHLKSLAINLHREVDFEISGFLNLLELSVAFNNCQSMRLRIVNMPALIAVLSVTASSGKKTQSLEFQGVPNLRSFSSVNLDHDLKELIFHDAVPMLECIKLGSLDDDLVVCDPHHQVVWSNIKTLDLPFVECTASIFLQLREIKDLTIIFLDDIIQDIKWSQYAKLRKLNLAWPNSQCVSTLACLTSLADLTLFWDSPLVVFDFTTLVPLCNLSRVYLVCDSTYEHFELICSLPKLQDLHAEMKPITNAERGALQKWETVDCCDSCRSRRIRKDDDYYHRCLIK
jgi:hypothetical protein